MTQTNDPPSDRWVSIGLKACQEPLVTQECPVCHAVSLRCEWNLLGDESRAADMDIVCLSCREKQSIRLVLPPGVADFFPLTRLAPIRQAISDAIRPISDALREHVKELPTFSLFANPLWLEAGWSATTFRWHPSSDAPPVMGLVFENVEAGKQLFRQWTDQCGNKDELEELRVSVIEGDIPGQQPGYTVHLCPDPENSLVRATAEGVVIKGVPLMLLGHMRRMHPIPGTPGMLQRFKEEFGRHREYLLAPVTRRLDGQLWFDVNLSIVKRTIHFRNVQEIGENDIDAAVMHHLVVPDLPA